MRVLTALTKAELIKESFKTFILFDIIIDGTHYRFCDCDIPLFYSGYIYDVWSFQIDGINSSREQTVDSVSVKITELDSALGTKLKSYDPNGSTVNIYCCVHYDKSFNASVTYVATDTFNVDNSYDEIITVGLPVLIYCGVDGNKSGFVDSATVVGDNLVVVLTSDSDEITSNATNCVKNHEFFTLFKGEIGKWDMTEDEINISVVSIIARWKQRTLYRHPANCRWRVFKGTECAYAGGESSCDRSYARCAELSNTDNFGGFQYLPSIENKEVLWGPK